MWLFSKKVLFSEVNWVVSLDWKPLENVDVLWKCRWAWNDKEIVEKVKTNKE